MTLPDVYVAPNGTLDIGSQGNIMGELTIESAATVLGTGTITGNATIDGTYEVDIPSGYTTGGNAGLTVTGTVTIGSGATLEVNSATGSAIGLSTPVTLLTTSDGIDGTFTNITGNVGVGTQLQVVEIGDDLYIEDVPDGSGSATASSIPAPFAAYARAGNGLAAAGVLDQLLKRFAADPSTLNSTQTALIDAATSVSAAAVPQLLSGLSGQIHADMVAAQPQAGWQLENSVYGHLGDEAGAPGTGSRVWADVSTESGQRGSDNVASGFNSNVSQIVAGADLLARGKAILGIGYAYTTDNVTETTDNGNMTENGGFLYGQLLVGRFMVSGIGSYGVSSTDTQRVNPLGGGLLKDNHVGGDNAMVSMNVSLPIALRTVTLAPYGRVTWQRVSQASTSEGTASAAALDIASYAGNDVRGMIGLTAGSPVSSPLAAQATYKLDLGVGADAGNLLSPVLNSTLAGLAMPIAAPQASTVFAQASVTGTLRVAKTSYLYGQLSGEVQ
jgi:fibronectin-binding autotransporter adhesin